MIVKDVKIITVKRMTMIFLTFVMIVATYYVFAYFAGNIGTFFNFDSIFIILLGLIFSSLSVSLGKKKIYFEGIRQKFRLTTYTRNNIFSDINQNQIGELSGTT